MLTLYRPTLMVACDTDSFTAVELSSTGVVMLANLRSVASSISIYQSMMKGPPQLCMVQLMVVSAPTETTGVGSEVLVSSGGRENTGMRMCGRESPNLTYQQHRDMLQMCSQIHFHRQQKLHDICTLHNPQMMHY